MMDSGKFDHKFMREWESLPKHEKTWDALKEYFGNEYVSLVRYQANLKGKMGSINQMMEQILITRRPRIEKSPNTWKG